MKQTGTPPQFINNNGYEFITNGKDHQDFPDGIMINKIKLIANIPEHLREKIIFNIGLNTLGLNSYLNEADLLTFLWSVNACKKFVSKPLTNTKMKIIVDLIFKKREKDGSIVLVPNTLVYTVYSRNCELTKVEKSTHTNQLKGNKKTTKTIVAIYESIESWDSTEKLTQKSILVKSGYSIGTIKKHWSKFKDLVKDINKGNKKLSIEDDVKPFEATIIQLNIPIESQPIIVDEDDSVIMAEYFERMKTKYKY